MGKLFTDSLQELKNLKSMVMAAMLLAIAVVLGFFTLQLTEFIKIGFAYIANEFAGKVKVAKANVDEQMALAMEYKVEVIPTLFFFKNGQVVKKTVGVQTKQEILSTVFTL